MEIRLAGIVNDSIVDGPGLRMTVFTQGCCWHCAGCHNQQTWDLNGGYFEDTEAIIQKMKSNPLLSGITLSGGEPFLQEEACVCLAKAAHQLGLNVWVYTGFTWEKLMENDHPLLRDTDVLVDGPFLRNKRSLDLAFRGSSNQRIIDVQRTINADSGKIIEYTTDW